MTLSRFQVAIKAFTLRRGELLMVREAAGRRLWELPGGRVEVGEEQLPPEAVLRRELWEELGRAFEVEIQRPIATWVRKPAPPRRKSFVFLVGLLCRYRRGEIELSDEHVEYRWMTRAACARVSLAPGYVGALEQFWRAVDA